MDGRRWHCRGRHRQRGERHDELLARVLGGGLQGKPHVGAPAETVIPLTAKRTFWLRVSKDGLTVSRDGEHFGVKPRTPGSFRAGVSATRARGVRAEVVVTTPQP